VPAVSLLGKSRPLVRRISVVSASPLMARVRARLTGRILAELSLHGKTDLPGGRDVAALFALERNW